MSISLAIVFIVGAKSSGRLEGARYRCDYLGGHLAPCLVEHGQWGLHARQAHLQPAGSLLNTKSLDVLRGLL